VKHQQKSLRLLVRSSHLFAKVISSSEEVSGSEETGSKGGRLAGGLAYALGLVCSGCTASRRGELLYKAVWSGSGGLLAEKSLGTKGTASTSSSTRLTRISAPSLDNSSADICEES